MLSEKLKQARLLIGKSQQDAAMESGLSQRDISFLENNKKEFIPTAYIQYLNNLGVDLNTLYHPDRNVHLNVHLNVHPIAHLNEKTDNKVAAGPTKKAGDPPGNVLLIPVKARAGYLAGFGDTNFLSSLVSFNIPGCKNGRYRMFEIEGYSMFPTFSTGDFVVGERIDSFDEMREDTIYIIVSKADGVLIKRLLNIDKVSNNLAFSSDNADRDSYPNLSVAMQDVAEIWRFYILITRLAGEQGKVMGCLQNLDKKMVKILSILGSK